MADIHQKFHTALGVVEDMIDLRDLLDALHHKVASLDESVDVIADLRAGILVLQGDVNYYIDRAIEERQGGSGEYDDERSQYNSKHSRGC